MAIHSLVPHPDHPPRGVSGVVVEITNDVALTFSVASYEFLRLPEPVSSVRADNLWQTTCFEMFLSPPESDEYFEFNFSPSTRWAAYRFDARRTGMRDLALATAPHIGRGDEGATYAIDLNLSDLPHGAMRIGLSAVIEETDGTKSYWALAHAPGPPDFHNPDCFIATLPAPERP